MAVSFFKRVRRKTLATPGTLVADADRDKTTNAIPASEIFSVEKAIGHEFYLLFTDVSNAEVAGATVDVQVWKQDSGDGGWPIKVATKEHGLGGREMLSIDRVVGDLWFQFTNLQNGGTVKYIDVFVAAKEGV